MSNADRAGELLKGDFDRKHGCRAIGGVVGAFILQVLSSIIGQAIVVAVSGAAVTVIAAAWIRRW